MIGVDENVIFGVMLPIAQCEVCTQLQQCTGINYRCNEKRPPAIGMLETLPRTGDDEDASTERRLLRCAACGTYYASSHYVLENEFMCPSYDEETIRRLSIDAALARLKEHGEPALAARRAELAGRKQAALAELAEMLVERRAPNWHIQRHAIECLLDAWLPDAARLEIVFAHPDPVVRAEAANDVFHIATAVAPGWAQRWAPPALAKAARYVIQHGRPHRMIESVLDEPSRESFRFSTDGAGTYSPSDTHVIAVDACKLAAWRDLPLGHLLERLLSLLGGERRISLEAQQALLHAMDHHPELKPRVRASIATLSAERRQDDNIRFLSEQAAP